MILLCAHHDTVRPDAFCALDGGQYVGLLDNALGMFACHSVIFRNQSLIRLAREGKLGVYHDSHEEFLLPIEGYHRRKKKPKLAIVVDVVSGTQYETYDAVIENLTISGKKFSTDLWQMLYEEGYMVAVKHFTGKEMEEDEAWMWKDLHVPTFSLLLPIEAEHDGYGWHQTNCVCPIGKFEQFLNILTRIICFCGETYANE